MSNSRSASWDPARLRLSSSETSPAPTSPRRRASPVRGKFVAGPIDVTWLAQARKLGVTALYVGLALWHLKGLKRADTFLVSNLTMQEWEVLPDAKNRALRALEKVGLIAVERRGKRSPRVSILLDAEPQL
jgi:hypothetical protein